MFQNHERQIGHFQPEPRAIRQRMGHETSKPVAPPEIGVAVVRLGRNVGARRPREPLHRRMGLDPGPAQPSFVDADKGVPNCAAHSVTAQRVYCTWAPPSSAFANGETPAPRSHSGLVLAARMTLPRFSVSSAISLGESEGDPQPPPPARATSPAASARAVTASQPLRAVMSGSGVWRCKTLVADAFLSGVSFGDTRSQSTPEVINAQAIRIHGSIRLVLVMGDINCKFPSSPSWRQTSGPDWQESRSRQGH